MSKYINTLNSLVKPIENIVICNLQNDHEQTPICLDDIKINCSKCIFSDASYNRELINSTKEILIKWVNDKNE